MPNSSPLPPGSIVGILGGGQLGRMLGLAAARLGMRTHIFCPDPESPAFDVTPLKTVADYDFVLRLARMQINEETNAEYRALQAEGAASGKLNTTGDSGKIPPVFYGMHNDLAVVTA